MGFYVLLFIRDCFSKIVVYAHSSLHYTNSSEYRSWCRYLTPDNSAHCYFGLRSMVKGFSLVVLGSCFDESLRRLYRIDLGETGTKARPIGIRENGNEFLCQKVCNYDGRGF